jgi:hypothetical protein
VRGPVTLVVLSVKKNAVRCRLLGIYRALMLRTRRVWDVVPGEIESVRLDVAALALAPLELEDQGAWTYRAHRGNLV